MGHKQIENLRYYTHLQYMHSQMYACEYIDIQTRTGESQTKGDHKLSGEKKGAQRHEVDR